MRDSFRVRSRFALLAVLVLAGSSVPQRVVAGASDSLSRRADPFPFGDREQAFVYSAPR